MSTPKTIIIKQGPRIDVVKLYRESRTTVVSRPGGQGIRGLRGPGIFPSETPPADPIVGDVWLDLSNA